MTELLTAAQMRAIEEAAIASGEVTGLELMERAGRGVVEAIFEEWPELDRTGGGAAPDPAHRQGRYAFGADDFSPEDRPGAPHPPGYLDNEEAAARRAVVLCGPGNNGGDGFVVARLLKERGWEVEVFLYGDPEKMPPDARVNYERWWAMGGVRPLDDLNREVEADPAMWFDLVVDAIFGTGLGRALPDEVAEVLCNSFRAYLSGPLVAVDIPSGLCADSGRSLVPQGYDLRRWPALDGLIGEACLTVTFHRRKLGHMLDVGPRHCHRLVVKDIGLKGTYDERAVHDAPAFARNAARQLAKGKEHHKYASGHVLVLSGSAGRTGAARLAARGALRIGAGLVTVGSPPDALPENAAHLTAIMLRAVADGDALGQVLEDRRINALCVGPSMGTGAREADLLKAALAAGRPVVLDADALTLLSGDPALIALLHPACVLTPHAGEFARLFPDIAERLAAPATKGPAYSKVDATREAAARAGCVVLYKGPDTVIADPSGQCSINSALYERAAPWLATAGSGDVLSGFITGLLARGLRPMEAAETGAWLHVECARKFGPGLIAEDLPEELPAVFRDLGL